MSKKDYQAFANEIKNIKALPYCKNPEQVRDTVIVFADICSKIFANDNYNYDPSRFYEACGID